jgi:hypothetical protein
MLGAAVGARDASRVANSTAAGVPIPVNAWTTFQTGGFPAEIVGYDSTVYAAAIRRHIVLGKYHHYSSEPNYCMDGWSYDENRWDILDCGTYWHTEHTMEGGHPVDAFVYLPNRASIVYWGGQSGSNQPEQAFHTWWWDVLGATGRDKLSGSRPGNIRVSAMAYDASLDKIVFYPDASFKLEIYDPESNRWTTPLTGGMFPPHGLTFPSLEWNPKDQKTYLYGGASGNNCNSGTLKFNGDVYTFDARKSFWRKPEVRPDPKEGFPPARWYAGFAYDPDDNMFLLVGGQNCSSSATGAVPVGLTDTWKLDMNLEQPQWTRLSPIANFRLKTPSDAPFQKLRYDPDHHAFVLILPSFNNTASKDGQWGNYAARVWVYCYSGTCANVGTASTEYAAPTRSLNRNADPITHTNQTWASDTAIAANENAVFTAWIETSTPFAGGLCEFHHPYVQSFAEGKWSRLGTDCTALDSNAAEFERDGEKPSVAVVKGTLWASWSESNHAGATPNTIFAKYWDGSSWSAGPIGTRNPVARAQQGFSQLLSVANKPTIGFIENNKAVFPDMTEAYIDQYDGTKWEPLGGKLNSRPNTRVESISIASDGDKPWACWTEEVLTGWSSVKPSQLFCAHWDGSNWKPAGSALNLSEADWAAEASVAYLNGRPYVAWTERSTAGNTILYMKSWNGSEWSFVGSEGLNRGGSDSWVFHPRLVADATRLYLSWEEQSKLNQHPQLYVSQWNGKEWSALGGSLNIAPSRGSVAHSSIAVSGSAPVVLWNEVQIGQLQQTYMKRWDGSIWVSYPSSAAPGASSRDRR